MPENKNFYTTGDVAKYCGVTLRTVINWIKNGRLRAHQLPGTRRDNRIVHADLVQFMQNNGLPIPENLLAGDAKKEDEGARLGNTSDETMRETNETMGEKKRALVVDDDRLMAKAIARVLHSAGFTTYISHDGFDAGRLFEKHQPQLMTLDLNMPKMDGFAVLEALEDRQHTKILVISALGDTYMQKALDKNADDVMSKPFDNQILLQRVNRLLES